MKDKAKYMLDILESISSIDEYLGKRRSFAKYVKKGNFDVQLNENLK